MDQLLRWRRHSTGQNLLAHRSVDLCAYSMQQTMSLHNSIVDQLKSSSIENDRYLTTSIFQTTGEWGRSYRDKNSERECLSIHKEKIDRTSASWKVARPTPIWLLEVQFDHMASSIHQLDTHDDNPFFEQPSCHVFVWIHQLTLKLRIPDQGMGMWMMHMWNLLLRST